MVRRLMTVWRRSNVLRTTPRPTFEQTCDDIGSGRFTHGQLAEIVQLASMHSDTLSQGTVE